MHHELVQNTYKNAMQVPVKKSDDQNKKTLRSTLSKFTSKACGSPTPLPEGTLKSAVTPYEDEYNLAISLQEADPIDL